MSDEEVLINNQNFESMRPESRASEYSDELFSDGEYTSDDENYDSASDYSDTDIEDEQSEGDHSDEEIFNSDDSWCDELLYQGADITVGETVLDILEIYIQNKLSKKALDHVLKKMYKFLPKPNKLPKSKYLFLKLLGNLLPKDCELSRKHRICESCSYLLGNWSDTSKLTACTNCQSNKINGAFYEFKLDAVLKSLFETRNLAELLLKHKDDHKNDEEHYYSDFTSGTRIKYLKSTVMTKDEDFFTMQYRRYPT